MTVRHAEIVVDSYRVITCNDGLPELYDHYREHAVLVDEIDLSSSKEALSFFGVGNQSWPSLIVTQRYEPAGYGFYPGILIVPETAIAFIGAGVRLLAYRLDPTPVRLWIDQTDRGFWTWARHGDFVLMSAELELAAFTITGTKLWAMFVEPPWTYEVLEDIVHLDVMGEKTSFSIGKGPERHEKPT